MRDGGFGEGERSGVPKIAAPEGVRNEWQTLKLARVYDRDDGVEGLMKKVNGLGIDAGQMFRQELFPPIGKKTVVDKSEAELKPLWSILAVHVDNETYRRMRGGFEEVELPLHVNEWDDGTQSMEFRALGQDEDGVGKVRARFGYEYYSVDSKKARELLNKPVEVLQREKVQRLKKQRDSGDLKDTDYVMFHENAADEEWSVLVEVGEKTQVRNYGELERAAIKAGVSVAENIASHDQDNYKAQVVGLVHRITYRGDKPERV